MWVFDAELRSEVLLQEFLAVDFLFIASKLVIGTKYSFWRQVSMAPATPFALC
jgi:hypothetical protein